MKNRAYRRKHPTLTFALRLAAITVFVVMITFIVFSDLPPNLKQVADMRGIYIFGELIFMIILGSILWANMKRVDRKMADDMWYRMRSSIRSEEGHE